MEATADKKNASDARTWILDILCIFALSSVLYLGLSFMRPLASPDEGRYSEIPREMVSGSDYVTPRLNGMPYFYKPPMFYWIQAASIKHFGINRISLRAPNSLIAVFGIVMTYVAARALFDRKTAIFSAAILSTSALYLAMGQIVTLDMAVAVFMSAAMFSFIVAIKRSGVWRWIWGLSFAAFMAAAILTKGLIGVVIPCSVVFLYMLAIGWRNFWGQFGRADIWLVLAGIALFAAIALPWHVLAALANPAFENAEGFLSKNGDGQGFLWYYIIHEHFLRYIDESTSMRYQPAWFFFALAPVGLIPWIVFAPRALAEYFSDSRGQFRTKNTALLYMIIWAVFIVCFFSISKSKLPPYITPIYPATAVLLGWWAARLWDGRSRAMPESWILAVLGYVSPIAFVPIYFILQAKGKLYDPQYAVAAMSLCAATMVVGTSISLAMLLKRRTRAFAVSAFATVFCFTLFFNPIALIFQRPSSESLAKQILPELGDDDAIVIYTDYGVYQDLPVWLERLPICVGNPPEEQKFGFMRERGKHDARFLDGDAGFARFAKSRKGAIYMFTRTRDVERLQKLYPDAKLIGREGFMAMMKIDEKDNAGK